MNGLALCAGAGGIELSLRLALGPSYTTVCYVERELYCAEVLVARMEDGTIDHAPIWDSLESFDGNPFRGTVDIITAGLPCQPYSVAGKKLGHDDERALWPHFIRIVEEVRPAVVFLENVVGFLREFGPVYSRLRHMGFVIAPPGIYTASECGAPHLRRRLFVLAAHPNRVSDLHATHANGEHAHGTVERWPGRGAEFTDSGGSTADANGEGLQRRGVSGRERAIEQSTGASSREAADADRRRWHQRPDQLALPFSEEDADANLKRLTEQRFEEHRREQGTYGRESYGLRPTWWLVGDRLSGGRVGTPWTIESPLLRVATGMAGRPRQLRAIGGGVVPAVAGRAFLELSETLGLEYDDAEV